MILFRSELVLYNNCVSSFFSTVQVPTGDEIICSISSIGLLTNEEECFSGVIQLIPSITDLPIKLKSYCHKFKYTITQLLLENIVSILIQCLL